ncbi:MAG: hypothetical protein VCA73_17850 [Roseibacillus sp.]|jgi:hypothetical protein
MKKELLRINRSVLADAPIWGVEESTEELLTRLETHELPVAYKPATHQDYVDRRA